MKRQIIHLSASPPTPPQKDITYPCKSNLSRKFLRELSLVQHHIHRNDDHEEDGRAQDDKLFLHDSCLAPTRMQTIDSADEKLDTSVYEIFFHCCCNVTEFCLLIGIHSKQTRNILFLKLKALVHNPY